MADDMFLMHDDASGPVTADAWGPYLAQLQAAGRLQGGGAIGAGVCVRKAGPPPDLTGHLSGFLRIAADSLDDAKTLVAGNPVVEAGGTVEIRELPRTG